MKKQETKLTIGRCGSMEVKATVQPAEGGKKPQVQTGGDLRSGKK